MEISESRDGHRLLNDVAIKVLSKVDNRILELSIAAWRIAGAACLVLLSFLSSAHAEVSHVTPTTFHADFEVGVTVQLSHVIRVDAALSVQAIDVLADDELE